MTLEGILPIWKPKGYTSHDVVAKVRRILKIKRIGHTGTLDPQVTGVLPLCIGRATRVVEYIQDLPKEYEANVWLGLATDTEDLTGTTIERMEGVSERLTPEQAVEAINRFVGDIEQVPPMYSAVKVEGKRLYELARQGVEVERKSRVVTIYRIDVLETDWSGEYPAVRFRVLCSKGTYIRTLCADIGKALGVPAVMAELVRTSTGNLTPERCLTLEQVQQLAEEGVLASHLVSMEEALRHLPQVRLHADQVAKALLGQKLRLDEDQRVGLERLQPDETGQIAAYSDGEPELLVGVYEWNAESGLLRPVKIFS
ncbi:tRNA pseudouridine(55) synthase TruB [Paenibacillus validus]|uniref:tRNA pseudouridine synthase B n=1 Tax=Paenibacillus validus TaxID=44253 RepID=A0A7X3CS72_9BACL|nr:MULTISPECIES: tRNA pseudouridine(55) synthase TruB [Paenibacillus]MED4603496.1 tRNA pseudouridine(55) synthase TruB [Paenibacillus validus]MED4607829.1 tRNA pseudouridine(55) synthase TruB [Paenibacillus validus]MUG70481.1 tRNA pseudouridine(55) synthase TruB [Paenibacillus validus]